VASDLPQDAHVQALDDSNQLAVSPEERLALVQQLLGQTACRELGIFALPAGFKLSVVIAVYNERPWIEELVRRVQAVPVPKEIIIVDDGSTDGTREVLRGMKGDNIQILRLPRNRGKGAALREGFRHTTGDVVLVQDADLEYDPAEYPRLLAPILGGRADVVYGSRFLGGDHRVLYFWHHVGNRFLTMVSNMLTDLNLTDMETGCKVFRREVLQCVRLTSNRFGFEPEITAKIARGKNPQWRVYEIPISYSGRTYQEGKKIGYKDGIAALFWIVRFWFSR
jgi:glycosyltransferase involved in cell wall biosynthesis